MPSIEFAVSYRYEFSKEGIELPITIRAGVLSVDFLAKVDTGAAHCIFERKYAEMLGLNLEPGRLQRFRTMTGFFSAYEHEVTLQTLDLEFSTSVFFAEDAAFSRNFLGRGGWLDRVRIGIIDYDRTLHLSAYDL